MPETSAFELPKAEEEQQQPKPPNCASCGVSTTSGKIIKFNNFNTHFFCDKCILNLVRCSECKGDDVYYNTHNSSVVEDKILCYLHFSLSFIRCHVCRKASKKSEAGYCCNFSFCHRCYVKALRDCNWCKLPILIGLTAQSYITPDTEQTQYYCQECYARKLKEEKDELFGITFNLNPNYNLTLATTMYTCSHCKQKKDPVEEGGVDTNGNILCFPCYAEYHDKTDSIFNSQRFPRIYQDRCYTAREKPIQFFDDRSAGYARVGIEIEAEHGIFLNEAEIDANKNILAVKSDGSISSWGMELLTQPASGRELVKSNQSVFGLLKERYWSSSKATGMHNHVEFADATLEEVKRLMIVGWIIEPFIEAKMPTYRRGGAYCKRFRSIFSIEELVKINDNDVDRFFYASGQAYKSVSKIEANRNKTSHGHSTRYTGLNIHSIFYRGTIEFRYPDTKIDANHANGWGLFLASVVEFTRNKNCKVNDLLKFLPAENIKAFPSDYSNLPVAGKRKTDIKVALDLIKTFDTPSMRLLKEVNPDFLKV